MKKGKKIRKTRYNIGKKELDRIWYRRISDTSEKRGTEFAQLYEVYESELFFCSLELQKCERSKVFGPILRYDNL